MGARPPGKPARATPLPPAFSTHMLGFLDYLQVECGLSLNTRKAYRRDLVRFFACLAALGVASLADLTARHVEEFLHASKRAGLAVSSIGRGLAAVRMFCRYLVIQRVLSSDVSSVVETPKKWRTLPTIIADADVRRLIAAPTGGARAAGVASIAGVPPARRAGILPAGVASVAGVPPARRAGILPAVPACDAPDAKAIALASRDQALLALLYACGLRASEAAGLKLYDVNANVGVIRVLGKGSKERIVPVAGPAMEMLEAYVRSSRPLLAACADPSAARSAVFLSRAGRPLSREDVFRIVRKHVRTAGLRGNVTPHTLRHCFATQLLSHGADLRSVQEMLGHADIATTQIYTHIDASRLKAIHKKFHPRP